MLQGEQHGGFSSPLHCWQVKYQISAFVTHLKMLEGEGQTNGVEAQLLQAPYNGGKVLGQTVEALAQVARGCQPSIEPVPAALSALHNDQVYLV